MYQSGSIPRLTGEGLADLGARKVEVLPFSHDRVATPFRTNHFSQPRGSSAFPLAGRLGGFLVHAATNASFVWPLCSRRAAYQDARAPVYFSAALATAIVLAVEGVAAVLVSAGA